jgi:hypothetical protein
LLRDESGNVLVMAALSMTGIMGFAALATDVGLLLRAKQNLQIAADAAATAGALDVKYGLSASTPALAAASSNGATNGTSGVIVTVNSPPASGPYASTAGFVEVNITEPSPTYFMQFHEHRCESRGRRSQSRPAMWLRGKSDRLRSAHPAGRVYAQCNRLHRLCELNGSRCY